MGQQPALGYQRRRTSRWSWLPTTLTCLLLLQAAVATAQPVEGMASPSEMVRSAPPGSEARALTDAHRIGKPVEVTSRRDATTEVYANPNGTLTANLHAATVRAPGQSILAGLPAPTAPAQTGWAIVFSGYPNGSYWGGDGEGVAKVGQCYNNGRCNGIGVARSYFQYNTGWLNGRIIIGASFRALNVYSPS